MRVTLWKSNSAMRALGAVALILALMGSFLLPGTVNAADPDTQVKILTKTAFGQRNMGGTFPRLKATQQFARITGRPGALSEGKNRYAVVIGSNYNEAVASGGEIPVVPPLSLELEFAQADAEDITGLLGAPREWGGYEFDAIIPLIGDDASRDNILNAIEQIKSLESRGDEVVFFYSGHGAQKMRAIGEQERSNEHPTWQVTNEGIVTYEGAGEEVDFLWDYELKNEFKDFDTNRIVFIFDSCAAGGMIDVASLGNIVCMATTKDGLAAEVGQMGEIEINHGLFTYLLLGAFWGAVPEADSYDHDGNPDIPDVTVEEAFNFASYSLIELSPIIQEYMELFFGPEIAAMWGTPTIRDWFLLRDLLL